MINLQIYKSYDEETMGECKIWRFYNINTGHFEVVTGKLINFRSWVGGFVDLVFKDKTYEARRDLAYTQIHGYNDIDEFIAYNTSPEYTYCQVNNMMKQVKAYQDLLNECTDEKVVPKKCEEYNIGDKVYIIKCTYDDCCPYVCESKILAVYKNEINAYDFYYNFNMITSSDYKIASSREECLNINRELLIRQFSKCKLEAEVANKYLRENVKFINDLVGLG
jgi:hypothetical protein